MNNPSGLGTSARRSGIRARLTRACRQRNLRSQAAVGIDLGTTNSLVSVVSDGAPVIVAGADGALLLPSVVRYTADGATRPNGCIRLSMRCKCNTVISALSGALHPAAGPVVGEAATQDADAASTCRHAKRLLGRRYDDVEGLAAALPYCIEADADGNAVVSLPSAGHVPPEQVCAEIVKVRARNPRAFATLGRSRASRVTAKP